MKDNVILLLLIDTGLTISIRCSAAKSLFLGTDGTTTKITLTWASVVESERHNVARGDHQVLRLPDGSQT